MTEWQSMDTVPKGRDAEGRICPCIFIAQYPKTGAWTDAYCGWVDDEGFMRWPHKFPPTHWMPQPAPPEVEMIVRIRWSQDTSGKQP